MAAGSYTLPAADAGNDQSPVVERRVGGKRRADVSAERRCRREMQLETGRGRAAPWDEDSGIRQLTQSEIEAFRYFQPV